MTCPKAPLAPSASALALAAALASTVAMPGSAKAQAIQATFSADPGRAVFSTTLVDGKPVDTINVLTPTAVVGWSPFDTGGGTDPILLLDKDATALFVRDVGTFTVLNRVVPTGAAANRPIRIDGTVLSRVSGNPAGTVMFYSPNGIIIGPSGTFDVGSLVLTTLEHPNNSDGSVALFGPDQNISAYGTFIDAGSYIETVPGSFIEVQQGALLRSRGVAAYTALVSPRIVQRGTIDSTGSAALIAAEEVTVTVRPNGLFDISFAVGTSDTNGVVHEGTTGGPTKTPADPDGRIYMAAVPKATAMTMLLGGNIGFEANAASVLGNGTVVLSAGYGVSNGTHQFVFNPSPTADLAITSETTPVRITSTLGAAAQRSLTVNARDADVTLAEDSFLSGQNGIEVLAEGDNGLVAEKNLSLLSDGLIRLAHSAQPGTAPTVIATDLLVSSTGNIVGETGSLVEARRDMFVQSFQESVTFDKVIAGDDIEIIGGEGNDTLNPIDAVTIAEGRVTGLGPDTEGDGSNVRILASDKVNTGMLDAVDRITIRATGGNLPMAGFIEGAGKLSAGAEITLYAKTGITGTQQLFAPVINLGGRSVALGEVNSQSTLRTVNELGVVTNPTSLETLAGVSIGTLTLRDAGGTLLDANISSLDIDVGTANAANINFAGNGTVRLDNTPGALAVSLQGGLVRSSGTISALSVEMSGSNVQFGTITPVAGALAADGGPVRITATDGSIIGGDIRNFAATGGVISLDATDNVDVGNLDGQWIEVLAGANAATGVLTSSTATPNFIRAGNDITIADTALAGALELTSANGNVTATRLTSAPPVTIDAAGTVTIGEQTGGDLTAIGADIVGLGPMSNGTGGVMDLTSRSGNITLDALSTGTLTINSAADLIYGSLLANGTGTINATGAGAGGNISSTTGSLDIGFGGSSSVGAVTAALDIDMTVTGDLAFDEISAGRLLNLTVADAATGNLSAPNGGRLRGGEGATIAAGTLAAGLVQGGTGSLGVTTGGFLTASGASADGIVSLAIGTTADVTGPVSAGDDLVATTGGDASLGALSIAPGGTDAQVDGFNIRVNAGGTLALGGATVPTPGGVPVAGVTLLESAGTMTVSGSVTRRLSQTELRSANGAITVNATAFGASLMDAALDISVTTTGAAVQQHGTVTAGGAITLAAAGDLSAGGAIQGDGDVSAAANGDIGLASVTSTNGAIAIRTLDTGAVTTAALTARNGLVIDGRTPSERVHSISTGAITVTQGDVLLDAVDSISTGAIQAANGSLALFKSGATGSITTGLLTVGNDFTLNSGGNASFAGITVGDDIRITVGGTLDTGSLQTTTGGTDNEADGRNIVVVGNVARTGTISFTSAGALTVTGSVAATGALQLGAAGAIETGALSGASVGVSGGTGINVGAITSPGAVTLANPLGLIQTGLIQTGANFALASPSRLALGGVTLTAPTAGSITILGLFDGLSSVGDLSAAAAGSTISAIAPGLTVGSVTTGGLASLIAHTGNLNTGNATAGDQLSLRGAGSLSAGNLSVTAGNLFLEAGSGVAVGNLSTPGGSIEITNGTGAIATGTIAVGNDFSLTTGSDLAFGDVTAGDDIRIATTGSANLGRLVVTGDGTDAESDGNAIALTAGGTLFVDHAETGGSFVATASRFETGPNTIITGGDIDLDIAGDILLGNSEAGGLLRARATGGGIAFGTISSGADMTLDATGPLTGTSATAGGALLARSDAGLALGTASAAGILSVGIDDAGSTGVVSLDSGTAGESLALFNLGSGAITAGTLQADGSVLVLANTGAITLASATARGTVGQIGGDGVLIFGGTGLPEPTGDVFVASAGAVSVGSADAARMLGLSGNGVTSAGTLSAGSDIRIESSAAVDLAILRAGDDITINAAGALVLDDAETAGTGPDDTAIYGSTASSLPFFAQGFDTPAGSDIVLRTTGPDGAMTLGAIAAADTLDSLASGSTQFASLAAGGDLSAVSAGSMTGGPAQAGGQALLDASEIAVGNVTAGTGATLVSASTLSAGAVSTAAGNVSLTANTGIDAGNLTATTGAVLLTNPVGTIAAGAVTSLDPFDLDTTSAVDLASVTSNGGGIAIASTLGVTTGDLLASGGPGQPGTIAVSGASLVTGDVTAPDLVTLTATAGSLQTGSVSGSALTLQAATSLDAAALTATSGDVALQAQGGITTGAISAVSGSVALANTLGTITTGLITVRDDFTLTTGSDLVFAGLTAGDDIRITTGGSATIDRLETTGLGTDAESDGATISLSSGGALFVGHAEAAGNFVADGASFATDGATIISAGDISVFAPGDVELGNSQAGGFLSAGSGANLSFGTISAGLSTGLFADGSVIGTSTTSGGDLTIRAQGNVSLDAATASGTALNPFSASSYDGNIFVISGGTARLDAATARSMIGAYGATRTEGTGAWQAGEDILVLSGGAASLGTLVSGNQIGVTAPDGILLGNATTLGNGPNDRFLELSLFTEPSFLINSGLTPASIVLTSSAGRIDFAALDAAENVIAFARDGIAGASITAGRDIDAQASADALALSGDATAVRNLNLTGTGVSLRDARVTGPAGYATIASTAGALALRDLTAPGFTLISQGGGMTARNLASTAPVGSGLEIAEIRALGGSFAFNTVSAQGNALIVGSEGGAVNGAVTAGNDIDLRSADPDALENSPWSFSGALSAGRDLRGQTNGQIQFSSMTAGRDVLASSDAGLAGGTVQAGRSVELGGTGSGPLTLGDLTAGSGSITLRALGGIATGSIAALNGPITLANVGGAIATGLITTGSDFTLTTDSPLDIAGITAGDDIRVTTSGAAAFGHLLATGTGQDDEPDGSNIALVAGGSLYVDHGEAANNFSANAASFATGDNTIITGGDIVIVTSGDADLGNSRAGGLISVDAGGAGLFGSTESGGSTGWRVGTTLTGTSALAGGAFSALAGSGVTVGAITATSASISAGGAAQVQSLAVSGAATIGATGPVSLVQGTVGSNLGLFSSGAGIAAPDLTVGGAVTASGTGVLLGSPGNLTVGSATASLAGVTVNAAGTITLTGEAIGPAVSLRSGDLVIGPNARVGALDRTAEVILINNGQRRTWIGGNGGTTSDYGLSNAEMQRIHARSILIDAPPALPPAGSGSALSTRAPDVILDQLDLTAAAPTAGPTAGNMANDGTFRIGTAGKLRTIGVASFTGLSPSGGVEIDAFDMIEIDPATGGLHLQASGGTPGGRLVLRSRAVAAASPTALAEIPSLPTLRDISNRLGLNDSGQVNDRGVLFADGITVFVRDAFYLQNTGQSAINPLSGFDQRRGFTAGASGMTVVTQGPETRVAINGRLIDGSGLFVTGLRTVPEVRFESLSGAGLLFDVDSTVNGCAILRTTACQIGLTQPNEPREGITVIRQGPTETGLMPLVLVQFTPQIDPAGNPVIDDPVTGAGNDDLWGDGQDEEKEEG